MKICWDNLEKLKYIGNNIWKKQRTGEHFIYNNSCKNCGEPFLSRKDSKGLFCSNFCVNNGIFYGKYIHSEETKKKMSELQQGKNNNNWQGGITKKNIPFFDTFAHQIDFCEEVRRNKETPNILEVKCAYCGKWYIPTRINVVNRTQGLNGTTTGENRLYCSKQCKQECPTYHKKLYPKGFKSATSREVQPQLRQLVFERDNHTCQKCGKHQNDLNVGLHCHHLTGVELNPIESADVDNCITLCKNCHKKAHKKPGMKYHEMRCK